MIQNSDLERTIMNNDFDGQCLLDIVVIGQLRAIRAITYY